jgi:anti-sigma factor RsiW
MITPGTPEELDLLLSCYLDGELELDARMELEDWLQRHPKGRARLDRLRTAAVALAGLGSPAEVPAGWTARAYRVGLGESQPPLKRMMYLGLGQAMSRPRAVGHGRGQRRAARRWRLRIRSRRS